MSAPLSTTFQRFLPRRRRDVKRAQIIVATLVIGSIAFLLVNPFWERASDLDRVAQGENPERVARSMLRLCKNTYGQPALKARMAELKPARRIEATTVASSLGCIEGIAPSYRAEFYLHTPSEKMNTVELVTLGQDAVEPTLIALDSSDELIHMRALRALTGLAPSMNRDQQRRVLTRLRKRPSSMLVNHVRDLMGEPQASAPAPTPAPLMLPDMMLPTLEPVELGDSLPSTPNKVLFQAKPQGTP